MEYFEVIMWKHFHHYQWIPPKIITEAEFSYIFFDLEQAVEKAVEHKLSGVRNDMMIMIYH